MTARAVQLAAQRYAEVLGKLEDARQQEAGANNHFKETVDARKHFDKEAKAHRHALEEALADALKDGFIP